MSWLGWGSQPALPTALELAVSFGVEDDTEKYKKRFEDRFDVFQSAQLLVNSMKPSPARETVLNEYAALYLPRHIRGCLAAPPWVSQIWWGVLQWLVRFPLFARYFRVHPESKMFFRDYTELFLPTIPTWEQMTKDGASMGAPESECNRMIAWALISYEICLHVASPPTVATLSGLSHSTRRALAQKLGPIFIQGEKPAYTRSHLRPSIQEKLEIVTSSTRRMYAWCTGQRDEKGFLEGVSSSGTILPWIHCQGKGKTPCVESEEELSACARCQAVRYCCVAHQKADWKLHKQSCFAPTW